MYPLIIILIVEHQKSITHSIKDTPASHSIQFAQNEGSHPGNSISIIETIRTQMQQSWSDENGLHMVDELV